MPFLHLNFADASTPMAKGTRVIWILSLAHYAFVGGDHEREAEFLLSRFDDVLRPFAR